VSQLNQSQFGNNHWNCELCNSYNDILTAHCWNCKNYRPINLVKIAERTKLNRSGILIITELENKNMAEKDRIELHTKFFNHEKILYSAMSFEERRNHREELAMILLEGRARMNAVDDIDREENALKGPKGREWLTSNQENNGSDALNQPKIRKERMTKADKLAADMANLGLSKDDINKMLGEVATVQSGGSVTTSTTREIKEKATYVFTKDNPVVNTKESLLADLTVSITEGIKSERPIEDLVSAAITAGHLANKILGPVSEVIEVKAEEKKEFNPAALFGAKK